MATWSATANEAIESIANQCNLSDAQKSDMHAKINRWADVIGRQNKNTWKIGNYSITATAENGEVLNVEVDM